MRLFVFTLLVACGSSGAPTPAPGSGSAAPAPPADARPSELVLPRLPAAPELDAAKVAAGKQLFATLGDKPCASCHGEHPGRGIPVLWNVAMYKAFGRDGHAATLEDEVREMATGFTGVTKIAERDVVAIAEYVRSIQCRETAYDRFAAGDQTALSEPQRRGLDAFFGKGACIVCHAPPSFSTATSRAITFDVGTGGAFKPPILRGVARSAPYLHDGSIPTLAAVVAQMASGGVPTPNLNPAMVDRKLTSPELADLEAFLGALDCGPR